MSGGLPLPAQRRRRRAIQLRGERVGVRCRLGQAKRRPNTGKEHNGVGSSLSLDPTYAYAYAYTLTLSPQAGRGSPVL
jgi:hypothetical protein